MRPEQPPRPQNDGLLAQIVSAAVAAPVAIGLTTLGAVASAAQWVIAVVTDLLPDAHSSRPRHNVQRVREQLDAARRAAEASGVLWSKVPDRSSRKR
jgi:hypothetical protein